MAKRKKQATPATPQAAGEPPSKYRVRLAANTPLAHPELILVAANETEAKRLFMAENGISGSDCNWCIDRVADEPVEPVTETTTEETQPQQPTDTPPSE